ncbi:MAG: (E)-4-hydroxy-3-methylbut-2-enyl-diphosphate synthase [Opitutales bacterium]
MDATTVLPPYCRSRFRTLRRFTREVKVGDVGVGGTNPIRAQSMTTTPTQDVEATVAQSIRLAEAGCEIIRITAQNKQAAAALKDIRTQLRAAGFDNPLVADIHFLPNAAMEAVEHMEKVRVNPGNYADKKKFAVREYSDSEYDAELQRLHEAFSPLVKRAKELGRALRIGTNHGSLSDRIMNRYGDSPLGMVESALEFIRIAESHGFQDIILSMKASNPKVMIQAYRLAVAKMLEEDMHYPLHLGVTEAGDGEDARIKSAIGIGSLLLDGLGDTLRVSLTEDPVAEVPVCQDLIRRVTALWAQGARTSSDETDAPDTGVDAYEYRRRETPTINLSPNVRVGGIESPAVIVDAPAQAQSADDLIAAIKLAHRTLRDSRIEGLVLRFGPSHRSLDSLASLGAELNRIVEFVVAELDPSIDAQDFQSFLTGWPEGLGLVVAPGAFSAQRSDSFKAWLALADQTKGLTLALILTQAEDVPALAKLLNDSPTDAIILSCMNAEGTHATGAVRQIMQALHEAEVPAPLWLRATPTTQILDEPHFGARLLEHAIFAGSLFCDGLGDILSVENDETEKPLPLAQQTSLVYNILQGARMRSSKTEFVACPSCGRTLFDLQTTTDRIRKRTGHLKDVTIAVMGCIVNGPGEMADADFGYVGGAPGKVNLYVGKTPVKFNIPEAEAVERLVDLITEHGKWVEAPADSEDADPTEELKVEV